PGNALTVTSAWPSFPPTTNFASNICDGRACCHPAGISHDGFPFPVSPGTRWVFVLAKCGFRDATPGVSTKETDFKKSTKAGFWKATTARSPADLKNQVTPSLGHTATW